MSQIAESLWNSPGLLPPAYSQPYNDDPRPQHYLLACQGCGATFEDDGYILECPACQTPSLLVSRYRATELIVAKKEDGFFRHRNWLPVRRSLPGSGATITFQSERLSSVTGLDNLWIAFNGYWPERDAHLLSGSFKELEALCVLGRLPANNKKIMVVASAGNTANAFVQACSMYGVRCLVIVPESALACLRCALPISSFVKVVAVTGDADYSDAIRLCERTARLPGFFAEGGAKNVARRDGLGTVLLNVFEKLGCLPDYYFQAIGSGTGAISVHEMACRLTGGRRPFPRLWLSQNFPFAPIYEAWRSKTRQLPHLSENDAKRQISQIGAQVLANRFPPYAVQGGLYDALVESQGTVVGITNPEAAAASRIFEDNEGIDIAPAAAVAFASLLKSARERLLPRHATVVLNVTGGGQRRLCNINSIPVEANLSIAGAQIESVQSMNEIAMLF